MSKKSESPKSEKQTYTLRLTARQMRVMARACELLARVHLGQLESVGYELEFQAKPPLPEGRPAPDTAVQSEMWAERRRLLSSLLRGLNTLVTGYANPGYGLSAHGLCDDAKVAHDLEHAIRHTLYQESGPHEGLAAWSVDGIAPYQSGPEPLAVIVTTRHSSEPEAPS